MSVYFAFSGKLFDLCRDVSVVSGDLSPTSGFDQLSSFRSQACSSRIRSLTCAWHGLACPAFLAF